MSACRDNDGLCELQELMTRSSGVVAVKKRIRHAHRNVVACRLRGGPPSQRATISSESFGGEDQVGKIPRAGIVEREEEVGKISERLQGRDHR